MGSTPYVPSTSFTDHSTNFPDAPHSGVDLDVEFAAVQISLDSETVERAKIQRSDGLIENNVVHPEALDANTRMLTLCNWQPRGPWQTGVDYIIKDVVTDDGIGYICTIPHTSTDIDVDFANGKWISLTALVGGGSGGSVASQVAFTPTGGLVSSNVQAAIAEVNGAKQDQDSVLNSLIGLSSAADKLPYFSGSGSFSLTDLPSYGRTLIAAASSALARTALALGDAATKNTGSSPGNVPIIDGGGKIDAAIIPTTSTPVGLMAGVFTLTPPSGWLLCNADTIGSAASAADNADDFYEELFLLLWTNSIDTYMPVSGGRGLSAQADWDADKTITLPDMRGRGLIGLDNMGGTSANRVTEAAADAMAGAGGSDLVSLGAANNGQHTHSLRTAEVAPDPGGGASTTTVLAPGGVQTSPTSTSGSGTSHQNMPPYMAGTWIIKF